MAIANEHNLHGAPVPDARPYGVRVTLRRGDPFRTLLGEDWQNTHWFATVRERDEALAEMSRRHEYSRAGDRPALTFEKVARLAERVGK